MPEKNKGKKGQKQGNAGPAPRRASKPPVPERQGLTDRPQLDSQLVDPANELRELLKRVDAADRTAAMARYEAGCTVRDIENKFGDAAVTQIAAHLGRGVSTLYRFATIAKRWTDTQFKELLMRRNQRGGVLTLTDLDRLQKLGNIEIEELLRRWETESLTKKGMADAARAKRGSLGHGHSKNGASQGTSSDRIGAEGPSAPDDDATSDADAIARQVDAVARAIGGLEEAAEGNPAARSAQAWRDVPLLSSRLMQLYNRYNDDRLLPARGQVDGFSQH